MMLLFIVGVTSILVVTIKMLVCHLDNSLFQGFGKCYTSGMAADVQQQRITGSDLWGPDSSGCGGLEAAHKLHGGLRVRSSHYSPLLEGMLRELASCCCWWRYHIPLKHQWTCTGLHAVISQKNVLFNSTNCLNYIFQKFFEIPMLKMIIASTAGFKIQWNPHFRFLWGAVVLNTNLRKILNWWDLAWTLVNWDHWNWMVNQETSTGARL